MRQGVVLGFFLLSIAMALVSGWLIGGVLADPAMRESVGTRFGTGTDLEQVFVPFFYLAGVQGLLVILGYLVSLNPRARSRPWVTMTLGAFAAGFTAGAALYAWVYQTLDARLWLSAVAAGAGASALVLGFELFNRWLWQSLVNKFDKRNMGSAALMFSRLALLWRPGQDALLLSVSMELFRRGARGEHAENLRRAYEEGKRTPELLELLCQLAASEKRPDEYLRYLRDLHEMFPEDEQLRGAFLEELLEQKRHPEALAHMEKYGVPDDEDELERYGTLLVEAGEHERALEAAARLAALEGIPMRRADAIVRAVLAADEDNLEAINLLADWAGRMARRDQQIRWLERSYSLDSSQRARGAKLAELFEAAGMMNRLEELLESMREDRPTDDELGFRYAKVLHANGRTARAIDVFKHLLDRGMDDAELHLSLAQACFEAERLEDAQRAVEAGKKATKDEESLAALKTLERRIERAAFSAELAQMLEESEQRPEDLDLQIRTLDRLVAAKHSDRAVAHADQLLRHHPAERPRVVSVLREGLAATSEGGFQLLNFLADLQVAEGDFDEALETVNLMARRSLNPATAIRDGAQKILRRSPHHLKTLRSMGDMYKDLGQFTEMIHAYSLYLANGGEESEAMDRALANAYMSLNDYPSARRFVNSLLKSAEGEESREQNRELLRRVIPMAIDSGHAEDAAEYQKQFETLAPGDKEARKLRQSVNEALGRERFAFLQKEIEAGKGDGTTLEELGDICMDQKDHNQAITYYQRAARQPGASPIPKVKLAYAFACKRMFDLAGETLAEITLKIDDDPAQLEDMMTWMYRTGEVLEEAHMYDRASRLFKQLMKVDAGYKDVIQRVEKLSRK